MCVVFFFFFPLFFMLAASARWDLTETCCVCSSIYILCSSWFSAADCTLSCPWGDEKPLSSGQTTQSTLYLCQAVPYACLVNALRDVRIGGNPLPHGSAGWVTKSQQVPSHPPFHPLICLSGRVRVCFCMGTTDGDIFAIFFFGFFFCFCFHKKQVQKFR